MLTCINKKNRIFNIFHQNNPDPKIELEYTNHYTLLIAILLSARTTDKSVNKATKELFKVADTAKKMLLLGEQALKEHIQTIGLFNKKAMSILKLSKKIIEDYNGKLIPDFAYLISLPGIGRKSANVFLSSAFLIPSIGVDTHVFRTSNRIGLVRTKNVLDAEKHLLQVIHKKWILKAHHWLVLHGRYTCKARKPLCDTCLIQEHCDFYALNNPRKTKTEE